MEGFGDAPVHDHHLAEAADHDVGRLDVAVEDAARVGERERVQDAQRRSRPAAQRVAAVVVGVAGAEPVEDVGERLALDVLHHEEVAALLVDAHVVDGHDVGVLELPDDADLLDEASRAEVSSSSGRRRLTATGRAMSWSCMRKTSPMPPVAMGRMGW